MVNEATIFAAITELKTQARKNYTKTARKFNIDRNTLRRRYEGKQAPRNVAQVEAQGLFDINQETALIERINILSHRGMPLISKFVENLVREMTQEYVGENWINRFIKRYNNVLNSVYLDSIDYSRRVADNSRYFEHYFKIVKSKLSKIESFIRLISNSL